MKKYFYDENYLLECGEKIDIDKYLKNDELPESGPVLTVFSEDSAKKMLKKTSEESSFSVIGKVVEFGTKDIIRGNIDGFGDTTLQKGRIFDENLGRTPTFSPNVTFETEQ